MVEMEAELYEAAELGRVKKLRQDFQRKIDVWEQVSPAGNTALHIAAYHGHKEFIRCLLEPCYEAPMQEKMFAFLQARNNRGNTALHEAARGGEYREMVEFLHKTDIFLARKLNSEAIRLINIRNDREESALFTAASNGRLSTVSFLLDERGAMYASSQGETPLFQALYRQHYELVKCFIKKNNLWASEAEMNDRGWTPLHFVASNSNCPISFVRMILEIDRSLCNKTDKVNCQTALHIAAKEGNVQIVKIILEFGRSCAEIEDGDGRTALHLAVENAKMSVVSLLLKETQRLVNVADKKGITALDIALEKSGRGELTFLYELIVYLLTRNNKEESWKLKRKRKRRVDSSPSEDLSKSEASEAINSISINAVLICTVTFAAAFTPPGGTEPNGKNGIFAVLGGSAVFKAFIVFDALAFCTSIIAAIILVYANGVGRMTAISFSAKLLPFSLYAMMASFTLAIYMFVASGCLWLTVFVIAAMIITCLFTFALTIAYLQPLALLLPAYNHISIAFQEKRMEYIIVIHAHAQAVRAAERFKQLGIVGQRRAQSTGEI